MCESLKTTANHSSPQPCASAVPLHFICATDQSMPNGQQPNSNVANTAHTPGEDCSRVQGPVKPER